MLGVPPPFETKPRCIYEGVTTSTPREISHVTWHKKNGFGQGLGAVPDQQTRDFSGGLANESKRLWLKSMEPKMTETIRRDSKMLSFQTKKSIVFLGVFLAVAQRNGARNSSLPTEASDQLLRLPRSLILRYTHNQLGGATASNQITRPSLCREWC